MLKLGGLHVVGTERHESRRIDNQLRGRSGRQGDPGSTRFFLSLVLTLPYSFTSEQLIFDSSSQCMESSTRVGRDEPTDLSALHGCRKLSPTSANA